MAGLKNLLGAAATYTAANIINSAIPFLLLPILTRILTPAEYGTVVMFTMVVGVFSTFTGLNLHGAVSVRYFEKDTDHPCFVGTTLTILVGSTLLVLLVVWLFALPLERWTEVPQFWLLAAVLASAAQFVIQIRLVMWQVTNQPVSYGVFQITQTLFNFSLSLGLILILGLGWEGRIIGIVTAISIFGVLALFSLQHKKLVSWKIKPAYIKSSLRFGVPLIPHTIGGLMLTMSDRFIVTSMLGVRETGVYAASLQIGMVIGIISSSCNKAFSPWLFKILNDDDRHKNAQIIRYTYILFIIMPFIAWLFGLSAPILLQLLVGEQFRGSEEIVQYIAMGGAFSGMYYLVANYIFFSGKTEWLFVATLISGISGLILTWWLVGKYGAVGAAIGNMLSHLICFILVWGLAAKCHTMPWTRSGIVSMFFGR